MNKLKAWVASHSKAIGSFVGTAVSAVAVKLWGHDLDPAVKIGIITAVSTLCTYFAPKNAPTS